MPSQTIKQATHDAVNRARRSKIGVLTLPVILVITLLGGGNQSWALWSQTISPLNVSVQTGAIPAPDVTGVQGTGTATFTWPDVTVNGAAVSGYECQTQLTATTWSAATSCNSGYVLTAAPRHSTTVRVRAKQSTWYSDWSSPVTVTQPATWVDIDRVSTGGTHSLAVDNYGWVWTWGHYTTSGFGDTVMRMTPARLPDYAFGGRRIVSVHGGGEQSLALDEYGSVWTWGRRSYGIDANPRTTPTQIPQSAFGNRTIKQVNSGWLHVKALATDGTVWVWGANSEGYLGLGDKVEKNDANHAACGRIWRAPSYQYLRSWFGSYAVTSDGSLFGWGYGVWDEWGATHTLLTPTQISNTAFGGRAVAQISRGGWHRMVLATDGTVWGKGENPSGELGLGDRTNRSAYTQIPQAKFDNLRVVHIRSTLNNTFAITEDGRLWHWGAAITEGHNYPDRIGIAGNATIASPQLIPPSYFGGRQITQVSWGSEQHIIAFADDGSLWAYCPPATVAPAGPMAEALVGDWALVVADQTGVEPSAESSAEPGDAEDFASTAFLCYHANGIGENLNDGECFNWHDDGTFTNANLIRTWRLTGDTLEIESVLGSTLTLTRTP